MSDASSGLENCFSFMSSFENYVNPSHPKVAELFFQNLCDIKEKFTLMKRIYVNFQTLSFYQPWINGLYLILYFVFFIMNVKATFTMHKGINPYNVVPRKGFNFFR